MKTLFVLRHAKAEADSPSGSDFDRPLKPRGWDDARNIGAAMRERRLSFDAIVASPALRVVETVSAVIEGAGSSVEPLFDPRAYNASAQALVAIIREFDDRFDRLLIAGHNPGLQQLLLHLADDDRDGLRDTVAASFSTATLAELRLAVDHWSEVGPRSGTIVSLVRPRDGDE